jgi:hypothetical protein
MRCYLINKNLSLYYWLRKKIGKKWACKLAIALEKGILILGRPKPENCSSGGEAAGLQNCRVR